MSPARLLVLGLVATACAPYSYVKKSGENPLAGQTVLMQDSLLYGSAEVDGMPESAWIAGQNDTWKDEWPGDQSRSAAEFSRELRAQAEAKGIKLTPQANPMGATLMLKPTVSDLRTGGWRPTILTLEVRVVDPQGAVVEEISTRVKVDSNFDKFEDRLDRAAVLAAHNVAQWLAERMAK